jgi:anaerobic selenocysteine-containing dehydrogenase
MIGTAEDHHSNPLKIALSKFKRDGGRFISINPVRTGYSAIADEWVPIRPGTDGALLLAIIHEIIATGLYDREFLVQYSNAGQLINVDEANDEFGFFVRTEVPTEEACYEPQDKLWWDRTTDRAVVTHKPGRRSFPARRVQAARRHAGEAGLPVAAGAGQGVHAGVGEPDHRHPGRDHPPPGHEMGVTARDQKIELPIAWTDSWGKEHDTVTGNPVAFHAMRGLAAHSNGFQTIRAMSILMSLLGTIDRPGGFRHKAPFPRPIPPCARTPNDPRAVQPNRRSTAWRWAGPRSGRPVRQRRRQPGAHRQGLLLGISAVGARPDAQRHHQCLARRPLPHRHAADLHGQHGLELDHERGRGAQDAQRQGRGRASTRSPSSSSATPSIRR